MTWWTLFLFKLFEFDHIMPSLFRVIMMFVFGKDLHIIVFTLVCCDELHFRVF